MSHLLAVSDAIAAHARLFPRRTGTRDSRRTLTFAEWDERATRLANGLLGLGLAKGDRVGLLAYNCVEWMEIYVALARAGLVAVPINFRLMSPEIAYILGHSRGAAHDRAARLSSTGSSRSAPKLPLPPGNYVQFGGPTPAGWLPTRP
jgi:acyl-CoA synthetase (AMP-forming)/AMP-acid ligase II